MIIYNHNNGVSMGFIYTWLNKRDEETFRKNLKKRGGTRYKYGQDCIRKAMREEGRYQTIITVVYSTLIFDLVVATILLLK